MGNDETSRRIPTSRGMNTEGGGCLTWMGEGDAFTAPRGASPAALRRWAVSPPLFFERVYRHARLRCTMGAVEGVQAHVWVQIVPTQRVVESGLRTILGAAHAPFRIDTSGPADADPEVVLYDVIMLRDGDATELEAW